MLFKLGFKEFKKNIFMNILVIIQTVIIFFAIFAIVSAIISKMQYYNAFKADFSSKGFMVFSDVLIIPESGEQRFIIEDYDTLKNGLTKAKNVVGWHDVWVANEGVQVRSYDNNVINAYTPNLESGNWINKKGKTDFVRGVISQNDRNVKVGDVIEINEAITEKPLNVEIVGILEENATVVGLQLGSENNKDYRFMFENYNSKVQEKSLLILNDSDLVNSGGYFTRQIHWNFMISFENDITEEELKNNEEILAKKISSVGSVMQLSTVNKNSLRYIFDELIKISPIIVGLLLLTIITVICINAISVKKQLRNYSVFCICGLEKSKCNLINLISTAFSLLISFAITIVVIFVTNNMNLLKNTVVYLGFEQVICCLIIGLFIIILSMIMPILTIKNTPLREILKEN